jgi:hypothetical protein
MSDDEEKRPVDVMLLHSPTDDGEGARVLRVKDDSLSVGEVRPVREGEPMNARELVRLRPRDGTPRVCDVETLYEPPRKSGPPKVATRRFREGWDAIFGTREPATDEPN